MIRSELVARIAAQNPHLYARDVEKMVVVILNRIAGALVDGDRVELRGFGIFAVRQREARKGRNPRTGARVEVDAKGQIRFKPGRTMQAQLNRAGDRAG